MTSNKYKTIACFGSKSAARKAQAALHRKGHTGRIVQTSTGYCVKSKGKRKVGIIARTGQRISGKRR